MLKRTRAGGISDNHNASALRVKCPGLHMKQQIAHIPGQAVTKDPSKIIDFDGQHFPVRLLRVLAVGLLSSVVDQKICGVGSGYTKCLAEDLECLNL
jgi:hypothetical protein